ncbi:class I SAM-dependent methyltransferase [Ilumatobacter nonamiensis]|uniref:class I SAM-dependent methyltransferase n=1 Tax=Ilumatobacter nonamiensis TaxID=467093 RepID=UPI000348FE81|nr:class I SAM-dependent methyltransferase [Ilumatobacter nonamiensis]
MTDRTNDQRPDLPAAMEAVAEVEGWMSPGQGATLYDAATRCPPDGLIVEIGSFRGRSTIVLATAAAPSVRIVAIDPHAGNDRGPQEIEGFEVDAADDHAVFTANLERAGVAARVEHVRAFSDAALDTVEGRPDLLYIDGAHRYGPALADIRAWGDRVADGGTMLIHDSFSSIGVTFAILRALVPGGRFRYVGRSRSMTIYRADLGGGLGARSTNAARQLAQLPWFVKNVTLKVLISAKLVRREWPY